MNLPAVVAAAGLALLVATEAFNAWNARGFESGSTSFKEAAKRKSLYKNIVLGVTLVSAIASVYSGIADKAESDAELATLKAGLQRINDRVSHIAATNADRADPRIDQMIGEVHELDEVSARKSDLKQLRAELDGVSARVDVLDRLVKRFEK